MVAFVLIRGAKFVECLIEMRSESIKGFLCLGIFPCYSIFSKMPTLFKDLEGCIYHLEIRDGIMLLDYVAEHSSGV